MCGKDGEVVPSRSLTRSEFSPQVLCLCLVPLDGALVGRFPLGRLPRIEEFLRRLAMGTHQTDKPRVDKDKFFRAVNVPSR